MEKKGFTVVDSIAEALSVAGGYDRMIAGSRALSKAPHANRPTPPRRHKLRRQVLQNIVYSPAYKFVGKLNKRLFR